MKVLVTGAFGNIGKYALDSLISRNHEVSAFDIRTKQTRKASRRFRKSVDIFWGDVRNEADLIPAVKGQDVVIHLAAVIPHLSFTGVNSEDAPEFAESVNVGGTRNLIWVMESQVVKPALIQGSSLHVFGKTQGMEPPRKVSDPVNPVEHYARHKVEIERMVAGSSLRFSIFRFAAALPMRLIMDPGMFNVPLNNRIEYVHARDVGLALANALETSEIWGKTLLIGGGKRCQFIYRDLMKKILGTVGFGNDFPEEAFSEEEYSTDWLDTEESERILQFQRRTLDAYWQELRGQLGGLRYLVRVFEPWVRMWLLRKSPFYK
jgi:UDP-glucose 4-epimerase